MKFDSLDATQVTYKYNSRLFIHCFLLWYLEVRRNLEIHNNIYDIVTQTLRDMMLALASLL